LAKGRLIYLLLIASLFAYMFACLNLGHFIHPGWGMSDGGGH
jgi:hypothetical protein